MSQQEGTRIALMAKTDYYPFGMAMSRRNVDGGYRYAYQGQEKDDETGMEVFQLRLWDARIGRWLTVDPYGQFHSPYLGMGNNPINFIDPDGGMCTDGKGNVIPCPEGYGDFTGPTTETIVFNEGTVMAPDTYNALEAAVVTAPGSTTQTLNIFRDIQTLNSTTSFFTFMDVTGYMLEPAGPDTTTPNQDLRIPEGTYNIRPHNGNAFQNVFNIYNDEVAQHRAILIHAGNTPEDTEGCLMPGCSRGTDRVNASRRKLNQLRDAINSVGVENVTVEIHNILHTNSHPLDNSLPGYSNKLNP